MKMMPHTATSPTAASTQRSSSTFWLCRYVRSCAQISMFLGLQQRRRKGSDAPRHKLYACARACVQAGR